MARKQLGTIEFEGETLSLSSTRYPDGNLCVVVDAADGTRYATLSVNLPDAAGSLRDGEFFAKTWSENARIAEALLRETGIFTDTGRRLHRGYAQVQVWSVGRPAAARHGTRNYRFVSTPSHAYLVVPRKDVEALALATRISGFSFEDAREGTVFLEEDCDAPAFLNAAEREGWTVRIGDDYRDALAPDLQPFSARRISRPLWGIRDSAANTVRSRLH